MYIALLLLCIRCRNLTHLTAKQITASFINHHAMLSDVFKTYKDAPSYSFPKLGYDSNKFIQTLLTEEQQTTMVTRMKDCFCPDEEYGVTSVRTTKI